MEKLFVGKIVTTHGIKGEIKILSGFQFKNKVFCVGNKLIIDDKEIRAKWLEFKENELINFITTTTNEIKKIKDLLKAKTLLIRNPRVSLITSNNSDKNVYNYTYDYIIENDGTLDDLRKKAKDFIMNI